MDFQPPPAYPTRHAYQTAHYVVSKTQLAALYRRYYVWVKDKEQASQRPYTSITHVTKLTSRRAYQSSSIGGPISMSYAPSRARRAYRTSPSKLHSQLPLTSRSLHVTIS